MPISINILSEGERAVSGNRENPVRVIDKEFELLKKVSYTKKNLREVCFQARR